MIKVLLVEDEKPAAMRLQKLIEDNDPDMRILDIKDSVAGTVQWLEQHPVPDLIFLDIQLADGLSFGIFDQVKINAPVIFVTAYDSYAIRAFEVNSIDYLLKPVDTERLVNALAKFRNLRVQFGQEAWEARLSELIKMYTVPKPEYKKRFLIPRADSLIPVTTNEIAYFISEDKLVSLVTFGSHRHPISYTLDQLESMLDPHDFFRVNRQYIVASPAIKKAHQYFNYKLKLELSPATNGEVIISREKAQEFKLWMNQ